MSRKRTNKPNDLEAEVLETEETKEDPANSYFLNREVCIRIWDQNIDEYVEHTGVYRGVGNLGSTEVIILDQVDEEDPTLLIRRGFGMDSFTEIYLRYIKR